MFYRVAVLLFAMTCSVMADNCFPTNDTTQIYAHNASTFRVEQVTTCPHTNTSANNYFLETDCVSGNLSNAQTSTYSLSNQDARIWVDRADDGTVTHKPNPPDGPNVNVDDGTHGSHPCFNKFTTKPIADASTQSKVSYTAGRWLTHNNKNGWLDYTRSAGVTDDHVLEWATFVSLAPTICNGVYTDANGTWYYSTDYIVEPVAKLADTPVTPTEIIELDYERHDGETITQTNALIAAIWQNIHALGFKLGIYTNPLDGNQQVANGIDGTNVDYLVAKSDYFGIFPYPFNVQGNTTIQTFNNQMAMLHSPDCNKLNLVVDGNMSVDDARALRAAITGGTCVFGGVEMFYDGASVGGTCDTPYEQDLQIIIGTIN